MAALSNMAAKIEGNRHTFENIHNWNVIIVFKLGHELVGSTMHHHTSQNLYLSEACGCTAHEIKCLH
jgi:hypothetical protein